MDSNCRWCWVGGWVSECTDGWLVNKTDWLTDWGSQQIWRHIVCGCEAQSSLQRTHFGFDKMNNTRPLGVFASNLRFYLSLANKMGCQWHLQRVRVGWGERTRSISESLETNRKKSPFGRSQIDKTFSIFRFSVQNLKEQIQQQHRILAVSQVLLVSGGEMLLPQNRVCSYSAGTDTNPIFMFSTIVEPSNQAQPWPSIDCGPGKLSWNEEGCGFCGWLRIGLTK